MLTFEEFHAKHELADFLYENQIDLSEAINAIDEGIIVIESQEQLDEFIRAAIGTARQIGSNLASAAKDKWSQMTTKGSPESTVEPVEKTDMKNTPETLKNWAKEKFGQAKDIYQSQASQVQKADAMKTAAKLVDIFKQQQRGDLSVQMQKILDSFQSGLRTNTKPKVAAKYKGAGSYGGY
jgi:hypothetical protein